MTPADNLRGIGLMTASMALFGLEDMFLKFAARDIPTGEILLVTCLFSWAFFAALARFEGKRTFTRDALHPWVMARNAGEMVGTLAYITALSLIHISEPTRH